MEIIYLIIVIVIIFILLCLFLKFYKGDKINKILILLVVVAIIGTIIFLVFFPKDKWESENYFMGIAQLTGGLFTVIGVYFTIKEEEKNQKNAEKNANEKIREQLRLENMPVLKFESNNDKKDCGGSIYYIDCDDKTENLKIQLNLEIKNVGLGSAQNIYYQLIIGIENDGSMSGIENQIIEPKEAISHTIYFELPKREEYYKNIIILVFYDDLLENKYMQKLDGCLSVSMNESEYVPGAFVCANEKYEKLGVDFKYELPQEIIDDELKRIEYEEKQKKIIQEIPEKKEIDKMVDKYLEEHKLFFDIILEYFKGLDFKFGSGGEIEDYKLLRKNLYNIIINSIDGVNKKEYIQCKIILRVNIKTKEIRCIDWYVKKSTLNIKRRKLKKFEKLVKKELKKIKENESKIYDVKLS